MHSGKIPEPLLPLFLFLVLASAGAIPARAGINSHPLDYDGDGRTDLTVWQPSSGSWQFVFSSTGQTYGTVWGQSGDIPVPGDYDGDGRADKAIWRPSDASWWIVFTKTGQEYSTTWGEPGDIPVPGDYDGDGKTDLAVWRPSDGSWWIIFSSTGQQYSTSWGEPGYIPVPADYDGDGKTDLAVWRPSDGSWWIVFSSTGQQYSTTWGEPGDIPVPADYDGDGRADLAVWRPSNGSWWMVFSNTGQTYSTTWGEPGDIPVPGDYDGDGKIDKATWRPSDGSWWIVFSKTGQEYSTQWGSSGDTVPGVRPITITGQVALNGAGISGVNIALGGTSSTVTTTNTNGNYSFVVPVGGTYTLTPSLPGYGFSPTSATYNNVSDNQLAEPFVEGNSQGGAQDNSLQCGQMQPEYLGAIADDSPTSLPIKIIGLSPNVTNAQFLVYNEVDEIGDAQIFPGSSPSTGNSSGVIGTNNLQKNGAYTVVAKVSGQNGWAYCSDKAYFTITSDLPPSQPQGACNGVVGTWTDSGSDGSTATWTLSQSGSSVTGSVTVSLGSCGSATWQASGTYQGNGVFSLQATNPQDPKACGAVPNNSESITISGSGCNSGSGTWTNSDGSNGTASWSSAASVPSGETSLFKTWDTHGYTTEARFGATVSSSNGELFGGRLVREQGSVSDGCWDSSSILKPVTQVDGASNTYAGAWAVQPDNSYGDDMIGYDPGAVLYYQQHRAQQKLSMPCVMSSQQEMQMQTGNKTWQAYQTNAITVTLGSATLEVKRNNADSGALQYPY